MWVGQLPSTTLLKNPSSSSDPNRFYERVAVAAFLVFLSLSSKPKWVTIYDRKEEEERLEGCRAKNGAAYFKEEGKKVKEEEEDHKKGGGRGGGRRRG